MNREERDATSLAYRWCVSGNHLTSDSMASKCEAIAHYSKTEADFEDGIKRLLRDRSEMTGDEINAVNYPLLQKDLKGEF